MAAIASLANRIDAEFATVEGKLKEFQSQQLEAHQGRQERLAQLEKVIANLQTIWKPRFDYLMSRFGERVQAKPRIVPATREVTFQFESRLANVALKLAAFTDRDIRKIILTYDLSIIPMLFKFKSHDEIEFPLNSVDPDAVGKWLDDQLVEFVRTYFSMGENELYLKDQMVEDPVTHTRFPKQAAGAELIWRGQTFYFVAEETRREFAKQNKVTVDLQA